MPSMVPTTMLTVIAESRSPSETEDGIRTDRQASAVADVQDDVKHSKLLS